MHLARLSKGQEASLPRPIWGLYHKSLLKPTSVLLTLPLLCSFPVDLVTNGFEIGGCKTFASTWQIVLSVYRLSQLKKWGGVPIGEKESGGKQTQVISAGRKAAALAIDRSGANRGRLFSAGALPQVGSAWKGGSHRAPGGNFPPANPTPPKSAAAKPVLRLSPGSKALPRCRPAPQGDVPGRHHRR